MPLQRMQADVLFLNPADVAEGSASLLESGFDTVEPLHDCIDPCGPAAFIRIWITTELDEDSFFDWTRKLVENLNLNADLIEAGLADPHPLAGLVIPLRGRN
jgi:hypothetical protein